MHNVKRTHLSEEARAARKKKEQAKLQGYLKLNNEVFARKASKDWGQEALNLTTRLLTENTELYSVWNYRRDILSNGIFPECTPSDINDILNTDLELTESFLRIHPKIYVIWNHRRWCLEHIPEGPEGNPMGWKSRFWGRELRTVEMMLEADARNFLAWNYRRYVIASMPTKIPEANELAYTLKKIEVNFSNFSAWHQRSKVLATMYDKGLIEEAKTKDEEFELVKNALYIDPYDQSAWIYHRWLIGEGSDRNILDREIGVIEELSEVEPDCKWCIESLVHYKRLLLEKHLRHETDNSGKPNIEQVTTECLSALSTLERIDPYRVRRYQEIGERLRSA